MHQSTVDWIHDRDLLAGGDLITLGTPRQPAHQLIEYLVLWLLIKEKKEKNAKWDPTCLQQRLVTFVLEYNLLHRSVCTRNAGGAEMQWAKPISEIFWKAATLTYTEKNNRAVSSLELRVYISWWKQPTKHLEMCHKTNIPQCSNKSKLMSRIN